ncbi:ABC transporter ATP-binding protein [Thermostichus vulcanus]|uniref:ABC transporter ATP-binding protein n=1 Tax=Thermostichus vulcanus str. 'Rupite' TaxID=2813851 RepID=A0ABT0CD47_THEVL|nr:ABC transporter ATP-binding protein [Thermostichus vulcanus]MCJ2543713.1 ABC transporter ATP-binding protein [Thermostichus vulcanus str. 'Rupite']
MSHLVLRHLSKCFHRQGIPALKDLSLTVAAGEIFALLGPSGCGKSTTLNLIAGLLEPDPVPYPGEIWLDGILLNPLPPERRGVTLLSQYSRLFPHMSVGENVAFGLKMRRIPKAEREAQALRMLERVQLAGFAHRRPAQLSGGQAQRVALARALVIQPKLLLLDEPLSALDANLRQEMQNLILDLQAESGVTTVLVTHDQAEATAMAQRIGLMFEGQLHQVGSPAEFYQQPASERIARFFGGVNFFDAQADHHELWVGEGIRLFYGAVPQQGKVRLTIRPEQIQVFSHPPTFPHNVCRAEVISERFTGTQRRLTVQTALGLLQAWVAPHQGFGVGQVVWIHLPPEALWCVEGSRSVPILPLAV